MKATLSILFFVIAMSVNGQNGAVTSAGENTTGSGKIVNWTIGSTVTGTSQTQKHRVYTGNIHPSYEVFYNQEGNKIKLDCFPNPAIEYFNLELHTNEYEGMTWVMYSAQGEKIKSGKLVSNTLEIQISSLSAATYLLNIYDSNNQLVSGAKLLKK